MKNQLTEEKKAQYLAIHEIVIEKENVVMWMQEPFRFDDKTASTEGHIMVVTPSVGGYKLRPVKNTYPIKATMLASFKVSRLAEAIKNAPMIDCYDEEEIKCEACNGKGEVTTEFYYQGRMYEIESECPICDGDGVIYKRSDQPNGKKEFNSADSLKIGQSFYKYELAEKVLKIATILNADEINVLDQSFDKMYMCLDGGDVEILLMSRIVDEGYSPIDTIELTPKID